MNTYPMTREWSFYSDTGFEQLWAVKHGATCDHVTGQEALPLRLKSDHNYGDDYYWWVQCGAMCFDISSPLIPPGSQILAATLRTAITIDAQETVADEWAVVNKFTPLNWQNCVISDWKRYDAASLSTDRSFKAGNLNPLSWAFNAVGLAYLKTVIAGDNVAKFMIQSRRTADEAPVWEQQLENHATIPCWNGDPALRAQLDITYGPGFTPKVIMM